ncbi:MAG: chemotaxis protein CheA [Pseudomonadota bacterium]
MTDGGETRRSATGGGTGTSRSAASASAPSDPMAEIRTGFFQECEELLEVLADGLEALRDGETNLENFHAVFRAVHSIKGGAAAFGLNDLTDFAHGLETQLVSYRDAGTVPDLRELPHLEKTADRLSVLIGLAAKGIELSEEERLADAALLSRNDLDSVSTTALFHLADASAAREVLTALAALGTVRTDVATDALPPLENYAPDACALTWQIELTTDLTAIALAAALEELDPAGTLHRTDVLDEVDLAKGDAASPDTPQKATGSQAGSGEAPASGPATQLAAPVPTIRVGLDRIDRLINLVGELVINQAMLSRSAEELGAQANSDHALGLEELMRLTRDLQDSVMQIRAQPVKPLFQRMARLCREAASASGKTVLLVTEGQDTEIDKTVIERLADPLTHMIRNAVDHAIEAPEERVEAGKPPEGQITLRASHRSGQVILEVIDDGAGINRKKVLERAQAKGLVARGAELSPSEVDHLLFLPGFSTADRVTALSGRGVGMDVVRAAIHGLGGRISIESTPGRGTRFEISLPLTLAVLDAMIISAGGQTLVLPLATIHETMTVRSADVLALTPSSRMLRYVGGAIALFDLGEALGYHDRRESLEDCVALIIEADGQPPTALVIDEIHEQRQVVIKGLQEGFSADTAVAGATILGDGRIALIIDPFDASLSGQPRAAHDMSAIPLNLHP